MAECGISCLQLVIVMGGPSCSDCWSIIDGSWLDGGRSQLHVGVGMSNVKSMIHLFTG